MSQLSLLDLPDVGAARRTDPDTSRAAARRAASTTGRILAAYRAHGTLTADEAVDVLRADGWHGPEGSVETAISRLVRQGELVDTDERRPSRYRCDQIVRAWPAHRLGRRVERVATGEWL